MTAPVVIMGVSGSGKTSVGRALAARLGWTFDDADDFHTPEAKAKMARGEGLTDADRAPWLDQLRALLAADQPVVLACSALKRTYREQLGAPRVRFAYLRVPVAVLRERLASRHHHYAGVGLLDSQLATLEEPAPIEHALTLDVGPAETPEHLAAQIAAWLQVRP